MIKARYIGNERKVTPLLASVREIVDSTNQLMAAKIAESRGKLARLMFNLRTRTRATARKQADKISAKELAIAVARVEQNLRDTLLKSQHECVDLVKEVAREIVGKAVAIEPSTLLLRIERGMRSLTDLHSLKIKVHPHYIDSVKPLAEKYSGIKIEPDENITDGDAALVTASGILRVSWRTHLDSIIQRLHAVLDSDPCKISHP